MPRRVIAVMLALGAFSVQAQPAPDLLMECHSRGARVECPMPFPARAVMRSNLSQVPCTPNRNYGTVGNRIWVDGGCGGLFELYRLDAGDQPPQGLPPPAQPELDAIECTSRRNRREECPVPRGWRGVQLVAQLGRFPCQLGETWGFENRRIWVEQGCSGRFVRGAPGEGSPPRGGSTPPPAAQAGVECISERNRYRRCATPESWRGVQLAENLSRTRCVEGDNWGFDRDGLWVDRGCGGRFVEAWTRPPGEIVRCESRAGALEHCLVDLRGARVRLVEQHSRAACIEGRSWGTDRRGIWVSDGCRADFELSR